MHEGGARCDDVAVKRVRLLLGRYEDALRLHLLADALLLLPPPPTPPLSSARERPLRRVADAIEFSRHRVCIARSPSSLSGSGYDSLIWVVVPVGSKSRQSELRFDSSAVYSPLTFSLSAASFAARNRRERCWFIFARGAQPSTNDPSTGTQPCIDMRRLTP